MNFSLNWFKSKKKEEAVELLLEEQKLKNKLLEKQLYTSDVSEKLYKRVKLVNDVLTVIMNDGSIISKSKATVQDFEDVRNSFSEDELFTVMAAKIELAEQKEAKKNEAIQKGAPLIDMTGDFVTDDGTFHLKELWDKGIRRSIPQLLAEKFIAVIGERSSIEELKDDVEYNSLKKFWLKCCLNPNAQSAEDLYEFLATHNMKIDKHGNFYAYRRVVSLGVEIDDKNLVDFISNSYNKIKAVWKKKPSDYTVLTTDNGYKLGKVNSEDDGSDVSLGNLEELYLNLPDMTENRYTDAHTGRMDYRVGSIASIPRNEGSDNNQISCGRGLHICSKEYDYHGFGDVPILTIVNPMDVLAAPLHDRAKMRTSRWFFAMTLPEDEKYILEDDDFDVSELGDIFEEQCSIDLENYVHEKIAEEVKRHTFSIPKLSGTDITNIVKSLDQMKEVLTKRVSVIK